MALQRLKEAAEKAKCELVDRAADRDRAALHLRRRLGPQAPQHRAHAPEVRGADRRAARAHDRALPRCLADAGLKPEQIDEVLLVGGQTRAPKVTEVVRKVFGKEPNRAVNPDEGVAMGAAIQTGIIQGEVKDLVLLDVTPHTLGIETKDGTFTSAHRAQQHDPDPQEPGLHHRRRQPDARRGPRPAGRERHGGVQQEPGQVRAHQHPARAEGRAADRGHLRDRRQRHRVGERAGPGHRPQPDDGDPPLGRPQPGRGQPPRGGDPRARVRGEGPEGPGGGGPPARRPRGQHDALGPGPRGQAHRRRAAAHPRRDREGEEGPRRVRPRRAAGAPRRTWRRRRASSARRCCGRDGRRRPTAAR